MYVTKLNNLAAKEYTSANFTLANIRKTMRELGNPQDCYPTIHLAGTNGKGSTAAIICSILMAAGYTVGFYTSPHFIDCRERIRINDKLIPRCKLERSLAAIFRGTSSALTYFEILTAAAFKYFADEKIDLLVCETGLGGRLDATNVIKKTLVSVITSVDYDHIEFLGNDLTKIASEKAGIIKRNSLAVVNTGHRSADQLVLKKCQKLKTPVYFLKQNFRAKKLAMDWGNKEQIFSYHGINRNYHQLSLKLLGNHQIRNAALALAAIELISNNINEDNGDNNNRAKNKKKYNYQISETAIRAGLKQVKWPGRLDIREKALALKLRGKNSKKVTVYEPTIILDGAHNLAGAKVLRETLITSPYIKCGITLIMSMMRDKDYRNICRQLKHIASKVIIFQVNSPRALASKILAQEWHKYLPKNKVLCAADIKSSLKLLTARDKVICVTGSLYGISEMIAILAVDER